VELAATDSVNPPVTAYETRLSDDESLAVSPMEYEVVGLNPASATELLPDSAAFELPAPVTSLLAPVVVESV